MVFFIAKKEKGKKYINCSTQPVNFDAILKMYPLSKSNQDKLIKNGFVVLSDQEYDYLSDCYFNLFHKEDISVIITTDAMLHIFHVLYDGLLENVEYEYLYDIITRILIKLQNESIEIYETISNTHSFIKESSRRNVEFFTVALSLIKNDTDIPKYVEENVKNLVKEILEHSTTNMYPGEDYTQYKPRGHYEGNRRLEQYFRCMTWLSRQIFLIKDERHPELARYQLTQAVIISQIFKKNSKIQQLLDTIYNVTSTLAGGSDSITIPLVHKAVTNVFGEGFTFDILENEDNIKKLRTEFSKSKYPESQIQAIPQSEPRQIPNKYIQFMGERYVVDGQVFQQTTFPNVSGRTIPKGLDVAATVLDSGRARVHLSDEIEKYPQLKTQLDGLQAKFAGFSETNWTKSVYNTWLYVLRSLTPEFREPYPSFMRNPAWYDEKLNTILASWTQLRHDNILYSKQTMVPAPYATGHGYVEPIPEFYARLGALAERIRTTISELNDISESYSSNLQTFKGWLNKFKVYAEKELKSEPLTQDEQNNIKRFGLELLSFFSGQSGGNGPKEKKPILVADVCTDSNSGSVLHEGSGKFNPIIVIYTEPDGTTRAGIGFVMSYYEFVEQNFNRLSDPEWEAMDESYRIPKRPKWVAGFLGQT